MGIAANGQRLSVRDANDNRSAYVYDGFDRLCRLYFPVTTVGANAANTGGISEGSLTCASGGTMMATTVFDPMYRPRDDFFLRVGLANS
jgi:hypothetical protein